MKTFISMLSRQVNNHKSQKALLLDRDGVINIDHGYAYQPEQIDFIEDIFELCNEARRKGYIIIVVTNQSGIARKYYSHDQFKKLSRWIAKQFWLRGITIQETLYCPHHPKFTHHCHCRKPRPGMLCKAIHRYNINPKRSIMIGDKLSDMRAAQTAKIGKRVLFAGQKNRYSPALKKAQQKGLFLSQNLASIQSIL